MGAEADFASIVRRLWRGHYVRIEASDEGVTEPGTPDTVLGVEGRNGWVELKVWPDPCSPVQVAWHADAVQRGSYAMVLCQVSGRRVWIGTAESYMTHFHGWLVVSRPRTIHLRDALSLIESALSCRRK